MTSVTYPSGFPTKRVSENSLGQCFSLLAQNYETLLNQSDFVFKAGSRAPFHSQHSDMNASWPGLLSTVLSVQSLLPEAWTLRCRVQMCQASWQMPHNRVEGRAAMTPVYTMGVFLRSFRVHLSFVGISTGALPRGPPQLTSLDLLTSSCTLCPCALSCSHHIQFRSLLALSTVLPQ